MLWWTLAGRVDPEGCSCPTLERRHNSRQPGTCRKAGSIPYCSSPFDRHRQAIAATIRPASSRLDLDFPCQG